MLRRFILIYTSQHLEVAPGYGDGVPRTPIRFVQQATLASNESGNTAAVGTAGYNRGPYLLRIPANPFNNLDTVQILGDEGTSRRRATTATAGCTRPRPARSVQITLARIVRPGITIIEGPG